MTLYTCFEELEASVPMSQLRPSVAFRRCAAHLPHDVDELHGDELVRSMEIALAVHSKARVVLQCWVLLIMRRRVDARHEKDALYHRLQQTAVSPQEKIRYRRGAMLLCHLLIEREVAGVDSLLDRYLVDFFFPWSSAVNDRDDTFYLQADVVHWVRQALDHLKQNGNKMTTARWLQLSCSSPSSSPSLVAPHDAPLLCSPQQYPLDSLAALATATTTSIESTPPALRTRSRDSDRSLSAPPLRSPARQEAASSTRCKRRRRTSAPSERRELVKLRKAIGLWAQRLRRQLLQAARSDDKEQIRQVADELQAPPLERCEDEGSAGECESGHDSHGDEDSDSGRRRGRGPRADHLSTSTDDSDDGSSSQPEQVNECSVCEAEPKRMEQVWNASCRHGFCGDCMLARLSQRERRCMYCRAKITQVVDGSGNVFQHYDWTRWWKERSQQLVS